MLMTILFPKTCAFCGKIGEAYVCPKCMTHLQPYGHIQTFSNHPIFQTHYYLFPYQGRIRQLLLQYKFLKQPHIFRFFSEILIKNKKMCRNLKKYDIILPVPISKKRKQERGYNQSALIAKEIAKKLHITYTEKTLIKIKDNAPQSRLTKKERRENVKYAYKLVFPEKILHKKVLLVDDIYTTGSTVKECSRLLQQAGAKEVSVLTIAKD